MPNEEWWGYVDNSRDVPDKEALRDSVNMAQIVTYLGLKWDEAHSKVQCPFHPDDRPSMMVNQHTVYCLADRRTWDVYQFLMDFLHISFGEAVCWLTDHAEGYTKTMAQRTVTRKSDYRGPVPMEIVNYYIRSLKPEHKIWLKEERLLTDETIEKNGIGWRSDLKAYAFPFWRGIPFQSEVDIIQFRSTQDSPLIRGEPWHYVGMEHHNRPSLLNRHRLGSAVTVTFWGTLDAYLAEQDGLAAGSINGSTVFLREENIERLKSSYNRQSVNFFIPDNTTSEVEPAYRTALHVPGGCVKHFPAEWVWFDAHGKRGKDYTNYRQSGKTVWDFLVEVLMRNAKDSILINDPQDREYIDSILLEMTQGNWETVETYLAVLEPKHVSKVVTHALMLRAQSDPHSALTGDEWAQFREELETAHRSYRDLARMLHQWTQIMFDRQGGF